MRIVYCAAGLWQSGGTERVLTTKVNWLAEHPEEGVKEVVLLLDDAERKPFFELSAKVRVESTNGNLEAALKCIKPDVTVAVSGSAMNSLPDMSDGSKKVMEFHYARGVQTMFVKHLHRIRLRQLHLLKMKWLQRKQEKMARRFDLMVGLTQWDVERWGAPNNMTWVHNPLSFRSERKSDLKTKRIIAVGSLTPVKGMDRLILAFAKLKDEYPDWRVDIYGEGQEKYYYEDLIREYGLENSVQIHPYSSKISEHMVDSSIYVFPSRSDGFGLVITEAMECGLPIVAFDCPCGPREILTPESGFLVPDGDIDGMAAAMSKLMASESLRCDMGKAALKRAMDFYPDVIMPKWVKIFKNL